MVGQAKGLAMKLAQVLFSTNRPEYLSRTLESQKFLDFTGCTVTKFFFDDFPLGRDDSQITSLATDHGYTNVRLHEKNEGIGLTWREFWNLIRDDNYSYIWSQEDDVIILEPVIIKELIDFLNAVPAASQCVLKRQNWYPHEVPAAPLPTDIVMGQFRGEFSAAAYYFTPIASLYPMRHVRFDYWKWYSEKYPNEPIWKTTNCNEAFVGKSLLEGFGLQSLHVKNRDGKNLIEHIGDYTQGRRLLIGEPGYPTFAKYDPEKRYDSRTGQELSL